METISPEAVRRLFEELIPFNKYLGLVVDEMSEAVTRLKLPFREAFIGNPELPALHGGVISMLLDTTGGAAVWSRISPADRTSTVDLRVDYLRPGRPEDLHCEGRVVRLGNHVGVVDLRAFHPGREDQPVAAGTGVYNVLRKKNGESLKASIESPTTPPQR